MSHCLKGFETDEIGKGTSWKAKLFLKLRKGLDKEPGHSENP